MLFICVLSVFNMLPDRIEGMGGTWLGKDFGPLEIIFNIYEIEDRKTIDNLNKSIFLFLKGCK